MVLDAGATDLFGFRSPGVWRVNRHDRFRLLVSSNRFLNDAFFAVPLGIDVEDADHVVVVDALLEAVVGVNVPGQERTIISK
jgi:hypothetical protein